jgi:hypothetical protein
LFLQSVNWHPNYKTERSLEISSSLWICSSLYNKIAILVILLIILTIYFSLKNRYEFVQYSTIKDHSEIFSFLFCFSIHLIHATLCNEIVLLVFIAYCIILRCVNVMPFIRVTRAATMRVKVFQGRSSC